PHNLQAVYTGDDTFDESISPAVTVTAGQVGTTLTLTTSDATADPGRAVTFTATVTSPQPGLPPTGSVTFFDGSNFLGTGFLSAGVAAFQTSTLAAGMHSITAFYSGDFMYSGSTSAPLTQTVSASYTVGLTVPQMTPTFGKPLALTAHVAANGGGSLPAGAQVLFRDAATPLGTATVNANGDATLTVSGLGIGPHSLAAVFTAGADFASNNVAVTVQKAATKASLRSTAPTSRQGQGVTLTATIAPPAAGMSAPTGSVTFKDGA